MNIDGWRYYNHAMIPTCAPHEEPDITPIKTGEIWNVSGGGTSALARWTTDWDCGYDTGWWYVIKDAPYDIFSLKAKRRYVINQGNRFFDVIEIDPLQYSEEIYSTQIAAFSAYPFAYRPSVKHDAFIKSIEDWKKSITFGAFFKETGRLCGYAKILTMEVIFHFPYKRQIRHMKNIK